MHFKIIVSLVTLLLSNFALAAPAPTNTRIELPPLSYFLSSNRTSSSNSPLAKREYDCDNYSAEDNTSSGSPTVNDCPQIMYNIQGGGSWLTDSAGTRVLASYGTCAFGVKSSAVLPFTVRNDDIIQLMYVSINNWQWYGLIGASGNMDCGLSVWWGIY